MNLVDFILDNVYFLVIILFAVFSIFSKVRGQSGQEEHRRPPQGMPPYGGNPQHGRPHSGRAQTGDPQQSRAGQSESDRSVQRRTETRPEQVGQTVSPRLEEIESRIEQLKRESDKLEAESALEQKSPYARKKIDPYALRVDRNTSSILGSEAVKGMMWSEIFGPPRAKRPYRGHIRKSYK